MSQWQIRVQDTDGDVSIVQVNSDITVDQFKYKVQEQIPEYGVETMRLLFGGKQLEGKVKLSSYDVENNSLIFLVQRMPGGSDRRAAIPKPPKDFDKIRKLDAKDRTLRFTSDQDCLDPFPPDKDAPLRVKMSCGHAVDSTSLAGYARTKVEEGHFEFRCPVKQCNKIWEYAEVRKIACLTDDECQWFESKLAKAAIMKICDMKQCPSCKRFVERRDHNNMRVNCTICTKKKGATYDFCWQCLRTWSGPHSTSSTGCGQPGCVSPELSSLLEAPMIKINGFDVPNRRACPKCGRVVEHNTKGCKNMTCTRCKQEFCFLCLEYTEDCLKTAPSSWYNKCSKPVAPRQTKLPMWHH